MTPEELKKTREPNIVKRMKETRDKVAKSYRIAFLEDYYDGHDDYIKALETINDEYFKGLEAVETFLNATGNDLCHENRKALAAAFGLESNDPITESIPTFYAGCLRYQREIYGVEAAKYQRQKLFEHYVAGLEAFAWWKDGTQFIGSCGKTLKEAIKEARKLYDA